MLVRCNSRRKLPRIDSGTPVGQAASVGRMDDTHRTLPAFRTVHLLNNEETRECHQIGIADEGEF